MVIGHGEISLKMIRKLMLSLWLSLLTLEGDMETEERRKILIVYIILEPPSYDINLSEKLCPLEK